MSTQLPAGDWLEPLASLETTTNSFIVVIRSKPRNVAGSMVEWHGSVEHAQSHERTYFIEYARLSEFIAARCEMPLLPAWRTRISRRWQKTGLHRFLQRLTVADPVKPVPRARG
jgi:hypothetical protein